jgi:hypothetical protein
MSLYSHWERPKENTRARVLGKFGKAMGLHDFRRCGDLHRHGRTREIGLIPGVLQHASPDMSEHYILARSVEASRRFAAHLARSRAKLRPIQLRNEG